MALTALRLLLGLQHRQSNLFYSKERCKGTHTGEKVPDNQNATHVEVRKELLKGWATRTRAKERKTPVTRVPLSMFTRAT